MDPVRHCDHLTGKEGAEGADLFFSVNGLCATNHGMFAFSHGVIGRL